MYRPLIKFIVLLQLPLLSTQQRDDTAGVDYRKTIVKSGYGINFDNIGQVLLGTNIAYFNHVFKVSVPKIVYNPLPIDNTCHTRATPVAVQLCRKTNEAIQRLNHQLFDTLQAINKKIHAEMYTTTTNLSHVPNKKRRRRGFFGDISKMFLPQYHEYGQIYSSLVGIPNRRDINKVAEYIRDAAAVRHETAEKVIQLRKQLVTFTAVENKRLDIIKETTDQEQRRIRQFEYAFSDLSDAIYNDSVLFLNATFNTLKMCARFHTELRPAIDRYFEAIERLWQEVDDWLAGWELLQRGFLDKKLVPVEDVKSVIDYIEQNMHESKMYWNDPYYYYTVPLTTYSMKQTRSSSSKSSGLAIYIHLSIPLVADTEVYSLYKIDTYPVPIGAGLSIVGDHTASGGKSLGKAFTQLDRELLPEYILISQMSDGDSYVELSGEYIEMCQQAKQTGLRICDVGLKLPYKRNFKTCAFALFEEDRVAIDAKCKFYFFNEYNHDGTLEHDIVVHIQADNSFLIVNNYKNILKPVQHKQNWRIHCPSSTTAEYTTVIPCDICRIVVPCFCSLRASNFYIPTRYAGCSIQQQTQQYEEEEQSKTSLSFKYSLNTLLATRLDFNKQLSQLSSDATRDIKYHHFALPNITFEIVDKYDQVIDIDRDQRIDIKKLEGSIRANATLYYNKESQILHEARNFSDQIIRRSGSIINALQTTMKLFGFDFRWLFMSQTLPIIISIIAFVIILPDGIGAIVKLVVKCEQLRLERQNQKDLFETMELLRYDDDHDDDDSDIN